jgi:AAA family ATP:ADP antiporter
MKSPIRVLPAERPRFVLVGLLLFVASLCWALNDVVGTTGLVNRVGPDKIVWVWAVQYLLVIQNAVVLALIVDRFSRLRLSIAIFGALALGCLILYGLFVAGAPDGLTYTLLMLVNGQFGSANALIVWGLAGDLFSVAEARRLYPSLRMVQLVGGLAGNGLAAGAAGWLGGNSAPLLLANAGLGLLAVASLTIALPRLRFTARAAGQQRQSLLVTLSDGLSFIREVAIFRWLGVALVLTGIAMITVDFQLLASANAAFPDRAGLQAFYGGFRMATMAGLFAFQALVASWLINRLGFKSVFLVLPSVLAGGLSLALIWPTLAIVAGGTWLSRITFQGLEISSRKTFQGLVPDERRGRVGAFLDGILYPLGIVCGSVGIGLVLLVVDRGLIVADLGRLIYLGLAAAASAGALWAILRFRARYDTGLLNWRLKRRRRSTLSGLDL